MKPQKYFQQVAMRLFPPLIEISVNAGAVRVVWVLGIKCILDCRLTCVGAAMYGYKGAACLDAKWWIIVHKSLLARAATQLISTLVDMYCFAVHRWLVLDQTFHATSATYPL